jgi:uncharacterized repeat protein (TIGR01451 family)
VRHYRGFGRGEHPPPQFGLTPPPPPFITSPALARTAHLAEKDFAMRTTWKRTVVGLLLGGAVGGAALGLAHPGDPPTFIPHADDTPPPLDLIPVVQVKATEPVVKNDPAVALEWSGPAVVRANSPTEYTLSVRNTCGQNLQKVVVQVRATKGTDITATSPEVKPTDGVYLWELGTLDAKTTRTVTVTLKQPAKGDMTCQAWVTLTGTSAMKAVVKEPKLAVTIKAPEKVVVGDEVKLEYTVANDGDHPASDVKWTLKGVAASDVSSLTQTGMKPGEVIAKKYLMATERGGPHVIEVVATGADGLKASAKATVQVVMPKLDVSVSGPKERLIGANSRYSVTVKNSGDIPVGGVTVSESLPSGFKVSVPDGGVQAGDKLTWQVGDLAPGAEKSFHFWGSTSAVGPLVHKVEATGDRNTKASGQCVTAIEGIPGLRMELVDSVDPVEKGGEITYEIKVTNTGTKADSDVRIFCQLPDELKFVSCSGPTKGEFVVSTPSVIVGPGGALPPPAGKFREVVFDPISDLAPKTEAVFKVKVKGTATGDVRFQAKMQSKHLTRPVTKEESTRVYGE